MCNVISDWADVAIAYSILVFLAVVFYTIRLFVNIYKAGQDARTKNK